MMPKPGHNRVKLFLKKRSFSCFICAIWFVCSRVRTRCESWGSLSSLCLTIVTVFAEKMFDFDMKRLVKDMDIFCACLKTSWNYGDKYAKY